MEAGERSQRDSLPLAYCPMNHECSWKITQMEKKKVPLQENNDMNSLLNYTSSQIIQANEMEGFIQNNGITVFPSVGLSKSG